MRIAPGAALILTLAIALPAAAQTLDRNAQRIVNDATKDLKNKDAAKRAAAIDNLRAWGGAQTLPLVIGALKDPDARVRFAAADALWDDKMKSETARPALMAALDDPAANVVVMAAGALGLLGVKPTELQKANERALSTGTDGRTRFLAARGLIGLVPPGGLVTPLVAYLEVQVRANSSEGVDLARAALERLVATRDRSILTPLKEATVNMSRGGHVMLAALGKARPLPDGWTALLVSQATRSDVPTRRQALVQMRELKADADVTQWAPVAARLLASDPDSAVRLYAASALGAAGGGAHPHAAAVLTAARQDRDADVREGSFKALGEIIGRTGTAPMSVKTAMAKTAQPEIQSAIDGDPDKDVREEAAKALKALVLEAPAAARTTNAPARANPDAEARGLGVLRANRIEFDEDQFYKALGDSNLEVTRAFLDAGMSPNMAFRTNGVTPLIVALSMEACSPSERPTDAKTVSIVQLIVSRGGSAAGADENGNTALMTAAMSGCDATIMSALIKAGAPLNAKNRAGLTAFEFGLFTSHDGLDAILAAGFRLSAERSKALLDAYKSNPKATALIRRATP